MTASLVTSCKKRYMRTPFCIKRGGGGFPPFERERQKKRRPTRACLMAPRFSSALPCNFQPLSLLLTGRSMHQDLYALNSPKIEFYVSFNLPLWQTDFIHLVSLNNTLQESKAWRKRCLEISVVYAFFNRAKEHLRRK